MGLLGKLAPLIGGTIGGVFGGPLGAAAGSSVGGMVGGGESGSASTPQQQGLDMGQLFKTGQAVTNFANPKMGKRLESADNALGSIYDTYSQLMGKGA